MKYTGEKVATNQERLNELFDADPRTDLAIAADLHVSRQTISAWRNGSRSPKKQMLIQIAEKFNVSIIWLMGYDVQNGGNKIPPAVAETEAPRTVEARILAKGIDQMPQAQREAIINMMQGLYPGLFETKGTDNDD